jgi:hypothetical protein
MRGTIGIAVNCVNDSGFEFAEVNKERLDSTV